MSEFKNYFYKKINEDILTESTKSMIGIEHSNGSIEAFYCHNDGYLGGVGKNLKSYYKDDKKVKELFKLGMVAGASTIEKNLEGSKYHSFNNPENDTSIFYGRDRGKNQRPEKFKDRNDFLRNYDQSYAYLYVEKESVWYYTDGDNDWTKI